VGKLSCTPMAYVSLIADGPNENGEYVYESLNEAEFDQAVEEAEIGEVVENLLWRLFGGGTHYEACNDWLGNEWLYVANGDDTIKIPDISGKIVCDEDAKYGLLISHDLSEYRWIVVEPAGSVYTG